ncbi:PEP-CTERM sorting domain-containing protein [Anabaena sp. CCY 0017]|uniref:PEP-CTERM sorting domain-containing protein n=1 Tax=Anabaena sp. CCY 0017 TaxID=3103866 RepID=UPI0039C6D519
MMRLLPLFASAAMVAVSGGSALGFTLVGSELRVGVELQSTPTSELLVSSFPVSAIVSESAVEFPDAQSLFNPGDFPGFFIVNTAIDAGADYLELDYSNAGSGGFSNIFKNNYVFTFTSPIALQITNVLIDPSTTLGITPDSVTFDGDRLTVSVRGLSYNSNSFVRLNLSGTTVPNPNPITVPEPSSLLGLGILALGGAMLKRRTQYKAV